MSCLGVLLHKGVHFELEGECVANDGFPSRGFFFNVIFMAGCARLGHNQRPGNPSTCDIIDCTIVPMGQMKFPNKN
jgi:hypothetical protein